jgi:hypothetical protein
MAVGYVHLLNNSSWKFLPLAAEQLLSGELVRYEKSRRYIRPVHHSQNHNYRDNLLQPAGRVAMLGQPSIAFGLIGFKYLSEEINSSRIFDIRDKNIVV